MPALRSWRQKDQELKATLSYIVSAEQAWVVQDPVLKQNKKKNLK